MSNDIQKTSPRQPANGTQAAASAPTPFVVPPVDVFEDESGITLLADLPGVPRDGLAVRVDGDSLHIEATAATAGPQDMTLLYGEAQVPAYRRRFTLSRELDSSAITAELKDGVLRLQIPRSEEAKPRRIPVNVG
jgi:HSP20 family protein